MISTPSSIIRRDRGFSLVETLVVMAIIAVLMLLAVPAVEQMLKGSKVSIAGNLLVDQLNLAQQTAISSNQPIEVRLYKLPAGEGNFSGSPEEYRALQIFRMRPDGTVQPLEKAVFFPAGIIVNASVAASSMLSTEESGPLIDRVEHQASDSNPVIELPKYGSNYRYRSFRFRSNGETDMKQTTAFLTLITKGDHIVDAPNNLPRNYVTVQVDPVNGRTRLYRP